MKKQKDIEDNSILIALIFLTGPFIYLGVLLWALQTVEWNELLYSICFIIAVFSLIIIYYLIVRKYTSKSMKRNEKVEDDKNN